MSDKRPEKSKAEDDWLNELTNETGNVANAEQRLIAETAVSSAVVLPLLFTPVTSGVLPSGATVEELSQTVQRMTLEHMPVNRSEGSSTGQVHVNPVGSDITSALQQMDAGVTALAQSISGGTLPL